MSVQESFEQKCWKRWKIPVLLLLCNLLIFVALSSFFKVKKSQETFLHSSGQEKYIDKTSDIVNWGYALYKLFKDNSNPDKR